MPQLSDLDLATLRSRHTLQSVPPCCVCGKPLVVQPGDGTEYRCTALDHSPVWTLELQRHWNDSRRTIRPGDPLIVALLDEHQAMREFLRDLIQELEDDPVGILIRQKVQAALHGTDPYV